MIKPIAYIMFSLISLQGCAQTKCNIVHAQAFYSVSTPGTQMMDENGNPVPPQVTINRSVYFEWCGSQKPEISAVQYDNMNMRVELSAIKGNTVVPGEDPDLNKEHSITAKKCNSLWKMVLYPSADKEVKQDSKNIVIKMKDKNKPCIIKLTKETALQAIPRY